MVSRAPGLLALALLLALAPPARADAPDLEHKAAPGWGLPRWFGLPAGRSVLEPADLRGRVVCLAAMDAATRQGLDAFRTVAVPRRGAEDVAFVCVLLSNPQARQDVVGAARRLAIALGVPVAADGSDVFRSAYGPPTRPWTWILDRRGIVRFSGATPDAKRLGLLVEAQRRVHRPTVPLVGKPFGDLSNLAFHTQDGRPHAFEAHRLTLVRWWTMHCPHCTASVPALATLQKRYAARGLAFLPVYHFKGGPPRSAGDVRAYLGRLGYRGGFAVDPGWRKLKDLMGRARFTKATSVSFLVDEKGTVVWAHPGPRVHPSESAKHAGPDADFRALEAWIHEHLPRR